MLYAIRTPQQLLEKLRRDIQQYCVHSPGDAGELSSMAWNCAITAFHLIEWTMKSADADTRLKLETMCALEGESREKKLWYKLARKIPEIGVCRDLADSAKHYEISWTASNADSYTSAKSGSLVTKDLIYLKVQICGEKIRLENIFENVLKFLESFVADPVKTLSYHDLK